MPKTFAWMSFAVLIAVGGGEGDEDEDDSDEEILLPADKDALSSEDDGTPSELHIETLKTAQSFIDALRTATLEH